MKEKDPAAGTWSVFFTKQPILDDKRNIWGYELLGGAFREGLFEVFPQQESAAGLSSSTYLGLQEAMERGKKIMVGFDVPGILSGAPQALPAASGVVRVLPGELGPEAMAEALRTLRQEGYQTVLEVNCAFLLPEALGSQADILSYDLTLGKPEAAWVISRDGPLVRKLARGVKTREQFGEAKDLGFTLFQGPFFKEPEYRPDRQLGSNEMARLNIFRLLEAEDPDLKVLSEAIRSDVAVSFRLLSYLNSAWFGFRHNIQSIDQAIVLLGWVKLKNRLRAVLFVDLAGKEEVPRELATLPLQRGRFLELLGTEVDYWGFNPNSLFLLGLFSLMDSILGMPMEKVVELLPIESKLKAALRHDPQSAYRPLFELLEALEDGDWPAFDTLNQQLFLDPDLVKTAFSRGRDWAGDFFAETKS